jgi:hypothetical protein
MSERDICLVIDSLLRKALGEKEVKMYYHGAGECTIDYVRPEIHQVMSERGLIPWLWTYGAGGMYIDEGKVKAGDVVVPFSKSLPKARELQDYGCTIYTRHHHTHPIEEKAGLKDVTTHVHFMCPLEDLIQFVHILTD